MHKACYYKYIVIRVKKKKKIHLASVDTGWPAVLQNVDLLFIPLQWLYCSSDVEQTSFEKNMLSVHAFVLQW